MEGGLRASGWPQEPLVGIKEGEITDGEILTDPMVEHYESYKERFDSFVERH